MYVHSTKGESDGRVSQLLAVTERRLGAAEHISNLLAAWQQAPAAHARARAPLQTSPPTLPLLAWPRPKISQHPPGACTR